MRVAVEELDDLQDEVVGRLIKLKAWTLEQAYMEQGGYAESEDRENRSCDRR